MPIDEAMVEINCLISSGGKLSEHKVRMLSEAKDEKTEVLNREEIIKNIAEQCKEKNISSQTTVDFINIINGGCYSPTTEEEVEKICAEQGQ